MHSQKYMIMDFLKIWGFPKLHKDGNIANKSLHKEEQIKFSKIFPPEG